MILTYIISIVKNLNLIHIGSTSCKIKATIKLGLLVSPFGLLWDKFKVWTVDNADYITVVLIAIAIDHILGSIKHAWFDKDFTFKKNILGLLMKVGLVVACGVLFEAFNVIIKDGNFIKEYLNIITRLIVFLYPAGSAFGNSAVISGGKFPPQAWLDKLRKFQSSLNTKDLSPEENNQQINEDQELPEFED